MVNEAVTPSVPEPAPLPVSSPERQTQDTLNRFLAEYEPTRLEPLLVLKMDRTQVLQRILDLERDGPADDLVNAYLLYITAYPPDPRSFLNSLARLTTVLGQRNTDPPLLTLLFQQADRFPPSASAVISIELSEVEFLLRVGLTQPALALLHEISERPGIEPAAHALATGRAGFLHERLDQPDEAVAAYLAAQQDLSTTPQANEAVLRGCLLELEIGQTDDALKSFAILQGVPPDMLRQSPAGPFIAEMLALTADPAAAKAFWRHQNDWFPQWLALADKLGVKQPGMGEAVTPYIEDYSRLGFEAGVALNQKDTAQYFQFVNELMRSARWRPSDLADASRLLFQGQTLAVDRTADMMAVGTAMEENLPPGQKELAMELAQTRVTELASLGRMDQARDAAGAALAQYGDDGTQGQALARLYGFAALRTNAATSAVGAEAARHLAETLADPDAHAGQRALAVEILCDLYLSQNRSGDAQILLEKEIAAPARPGTGGAQYQDELRNALVRLNQNQAQIAGLNSTLAAWWGQYALPWYQYALNTPALSDVNGADEPAVQAARSFAHALDPSATLPNRANALVEAWSPYPTLPLTAPEVVSATTAFSTRPEVPMDLRYIVWAKAMWHFLWTGQRDAAAQLFAVMPPVPQAQADQPSLQRWLDYLSLPRTAAAQQAFAQKILAEPKLNRFDLVLVVRVVEALARLGASDQAQVLAEQLQGAALDDSAAAQYQELRGNIAPLISQYQQAQPAYDALRALVLAERPDAVAAARLPARWVVLNDPTNPDLDLLTQSEAQQGLLATIRDRLAYGQHPLQAFIDYGETLSNSAADNDLRFQLFATAQRFTTQDNDRFYAAAMFVSLVDFDNPDLARRGWVELTPARSPDFPKAAGFLAYYDTLMKWRSGNTVDPTAALGPLNSPGLESYKLRLLLDYFLQHQDTAGLEKLLEARPEEDFLHPTVLGTYLQALRLLNRADALARALDAAHREIARAVVESWASPSWENAETVFELARGLGDPASYPREWVDYELSCLRNDDARDLLRISDAQLQHNWGELLDASTSYLARNPTEYDYYWPRAQALIQLGRPNEALEPLRVYVKYSQDEQDYPQAVQWLKKIETEPNPPVAPTAAANLPGR
jgi:hypothetical protein